MENVVLVIHLILALSLIGAVLMQRSEGAGLGLGGGVGGPSGSRSAATALGKFTWLIAIGFICTSIALTIIGARNATGSSVVDGIDLLPPVVEGETTPDLGDSLLPPSGDDEPLIPSGN